MKTLTKTFKPGEYLFRENDHSRELYIIQSGKVNVIRSSGGRELLLAEARKGVVLGEMALIDGKPRSASAKVIETCTALIINSDAFESKIKNIPPWYMSIIRVVSRRIRRADRRLHDIQRSNIGSSIILTSEYLIEKNKAEGNYPVGAGKMRNQIIKLLNTSSKQVVTILEFLNRNNFINISNGTVSCENSDRFKEYCRYIRNSLANKYRTVKQIPDALKKLIFQVTSTHPDILENIQTESLITSEEIENISEQSGCGYKLNEIISLLKEFKLVRIEKTDSKNGTIIYINCSNWQNVLDYNSYSSINPPL